jgi:hypothetical protein
MNVALIDLFYANEEWAKLRRPGAVDFAKRRLAGLSSHSAKTISPGIGLHPGLDDRLLAILLTRIVVKIQVFEAQRTDGRHLGDILAGFCPMEVRRIAGQNNDATGRIRLDLITVELIAQADVEDTGHDGVNSVLGVPGRHELHA